MSIESFPLPGAYNTRGGLAVYGTGADGNVTITGTVSLNRDMYYNNLTILANAQLDTNGYRVFIKDTLTMTDYTSVIGRLANTDKVGTILGGAPSSIKASDTLGGNGGLNPGQNFFGEAEFYNFSQAIAGYKFDAVLGTLRFLMGGSGGASGTVGVSGTTGSFTAGTAGTSGSAGSLGTRPGFESVVGASGGMGYTGSPGNPGSPGIGGAGGAAGAAGAGGAGGGVVIVSARNIVGSGIIRADGLAESPGSPGSSGLPGSPGSTGSPGAPGSPAPDFFTASYTYTVTNAYNYNVIYNFSGPPVPAANYGTYNFYNVYPYAGNPNLEFQITGYYYYYSTSQYNNYLAAYYTFSPYYFANARNPATVPGNARTAAGTARFGGNTPGPASVRWRTPSITGYNAPVTTYNAPFSYWNASTNSQAWNQVFKPASYGVFYYYNTQNDVNGNYYYQPVTLYNTGPISTGYNIYNFFYIPVGTAYNVVPIAATYSIEPSVYHTGGAGGAGGVGGAGGIGSAGLPGSPGTAGYVGGGGVVLVITEKDIPAAITTRAAAGVGNTGGATSGTVIIIKNEAVKDGN
jgi:hypothetical protein